MTASVPPSLRRNKLAAKQVFISCIVPVFNEEGLVGEFLKQLRTHLATLSEHFEIIAVDDGSSDQTPTLLRSLRDTLDFKFIAFSRNFGKEKAISAGLEHCQGEVAIIIDADFQHPFAVINEFLKKWSEGYDMVYGLRQNRADETILKRFFTRNFYRLLAMLSEIEIPADAGDFRLLDRNVVNALNNCQERSRFMKGLYNWVGHSSCAVPFTVQERAAGKSSWKFAKLTSLAITGLTAFSSIPLRIWAFIGFLISLLSFVCVIYIVAATLLHGNSVPGYATILVTIVFFGGIQLLSIGILGEYISRIFEEVKARPQYIIAEMQGFESPTNLM